MNRGGKESEGYTPKHAHDEELGAENPTALRLRECWISESISSNTSHHQPSIKNTTKETYQPTRIFFAVLPRIICAFNRRQRRPSAGHGSLILLYSPPSTFVLDELLYTRDCLLVLLLFRRGRPPSPPPPAYQPSPPPSPINTTAAASSFRIGCSSSPLSLCSSCSLTQNLLYWQRAEGKCLVAKGGVGRRQLTSHCWSQGKREGGREG